eukprot:GHRR01008510.1.p1 GENE.GHRR01008510.1~~GHRR01008510.1.p1  ORF type:complete len:101 (-),score=11.70 GHRR01008510.1:648-950(-)
MWVTSSMRPVFMPARCSARRADWTPGPGILILLPPVERSLMDSAVMPSSLLFAAMSWVANIAAYGEDSLRSAFTFMSPVTRTRVSLPVTSVLCTNVLADM